MSAVLKMVQEENPRLYSKPSPLPVDVVAPQHAVIHVDLERWGAWNREKYRPSTAASIEGGYRRTRAGDQTNEYPKLPIWLPPNPRNQQIERVVITMPMQHRTVLVMFYAERRAPTLICRQVALHWKEFGRRMFDCRAMVINGLRFGGS